MYRDGIIWTNSEYVHDEIRQAIAKYEIGKDGDMRGGIRRGINQQLRRRAWEEDDVSWIMYMDWSGECWDEVSGESLDKEGVKKAIYEEMLKLRKHDVYIFVPEEECWRVTGQGPIGTKWVDVNKGDKINPEYRSRLVAKAIKTDKRNDLFAATRHLRERSCYLRWQ